MSEGHERARTFRLPKRARLPGRLGVPAALTLAVFLLGPRARVEEEVAPVEVPADVDAWVGDREAGVPGIRAGDGKEVLWHDDAARTPTRLSVVYLHGFSGDRHELDPVPGRVAEALGANLFVTRLSGHGRDGAAMAEATAGDWLQDVEEALAVGASLGDRVVLVGTSTGGTLAAWATLQDRWRDRLHAVVLVSPNFMPADRNARLLLWPWGAWIARAVVGSERCFEAANPQQERHWTTCYPVEALLPMMAVVERVRTLDLGEATTPALVLLSPEDRVVDTAETRRRYEEYGGSPKRLESIEGVGDPGGHILAGDILSPDTNDRVVAVVLDFLETVDGTTGR